MSKSLRFTAACLITALFSLQALAQTVTIKGTVRDSISKDGVPAVSVTIKGTSEGTYTDDNGDFSISTSAKLPITLVFTSVGFESQEVNVSDGAAAVDVDFVAVSTLGQEVVVAAARTQQRIIDAPVTVERLSSSALRNAAVPNYYEALANLKGVDMHTASITFRTVTTRGFVSSGNTRFNQLIDGMDVLSKYALQLFERGKSIAAKRGLILADTKYEFGKLGNDIYLMDEVHTPDSSRYFYAEGFDERQTTGERQKQLSKEFVREWLIANNFMGKEGQVVPAMSDEWVNTISQRYIELYEKVIGEKFVPQQLSDNEIYDRIATSLKRYSST